MPAAARENLAWSLVAALALHGLVALTLRSAGSTDTSRAPNARMSSTLRSNRLPKSKPRDPRLKAPKRSSSRNVGP